jgi:hypothetical protein
MLLDMGKRRRVNRRLARVGVESTVGSSARLAESVHPVTRRRDKVVFGIVKTCWNGYGRDCNQIHLSVEATRRSAALSICAMASQRDPPHKASTSQEKAGGPRAPRSRRGTAIGDARVLGMLEGV